VLEAEPAAAAAADMDVAPRVGRQRLMMTQMVLENFKSYGGQQVIGPFHSVCVVARVEESWEGNTNADLVLHVELYIYRGPERKRQEQRD
jgi:hypothetical protein